MRRTLLIFLLTAAFSSVLSAQQVKGLVIQDSTVVRIPGAQISLLDEKGNLVEQAVRSDSAGRFTIHTRSPGRYQIRANRIGYQPSNTAFFDLGVRSIIEVQLNMSQNSILLDPMVITTRRVLTAGELLSVEGFEFRRHRIAGSFVDTAAIRTSGYPNFIAMAKMFVPGIYTEPDFFGNEALRLTVRSRPCEPILYRDGIKQMPLALVLLDDTKSQEFYGVEAYRQPNIPREFQETGSECAVIAVWTKWHALARSGE